MRAAAVHRAASGVIEQKAVERAKYEMKCPSCESRENTVKDSRPLDLAIRRRRQCRTCHHRWTTIEAAIDDNASTTQILTAEWAKIHDLSEQVSDLKIQNSVLRAQKLNYFLDDRPHLVFVLGTGSSPPYKIGIARNADKVRNQYLEPTLTGLKLLYQNRQDRALYAQITKQQA
jgi:transcription repressor NrdR-like protein